MAWQSSSRPLRRTPRSCTDSECEGMMVMIMIRMMITTMMMVMIMSIMMFIIMIVMMFMVKFHLD